MNAEPEADAISLRMFVDSLRACSDPTKRRAADVIEQLLNSFSDGAKWTPVTERPLPKDDGTYLVTDGKHVAPMVRALIENNVGTPWDWDFGAKITHWMPLPEAPK